jgi:hypothetical protein
MEQLLLTSLLDCETHNCISEPEQALWSKEADVLECVFQNEIFLHCINKYQKTSL